MSEEKTELETTEESHDEWRERARLWEKRATADKKRADDAEASIAGLKAQLDEANAKAQAAQAEIDKARSERERTELVAKVADKHGIDQKFRALLTGADEEALEAQAALLEERFAEPVAADSGENKKFAPADDELRRLAHDLFGKK